MSGIDGGVRAARRRLGILDAAEKRLYGGKRDLDDLICDKAMGVAVYALDRVLVGRVNEAKSGAPPLVKPVCEEFNSILILDFEVLAMRLANVCRGYP